MKNLLYLFTVALLFASCQPNSLHTIDISRADSLTNKINFSTIISKIRYTKLSTPPGIDIGKIIDLECSDSYIFVLSQTQSGILQFDINGRFIKTITLVAPKKENVLATSFALDNANRLLLVGGNGRIDIYNLSGRYLSTIETSDNYGVVIRALSSGLVAKIAHNKQANVADSTFRYVSVINYAGRELSFLAHKDSTLFDLTSTTSRHYILGEPTLYSQISDGSMMLYSQLSDTIYNLNAKGATPYATVNMGGGVAYKRHIADPKRRIINKKYTHISSFINTPSAIYLRTICNDSTSIIRYDKPTKSATCYLSNQRNDPFTSHLTAFNNNYDGSVGCWPQFSLKNGWFATIIYPDNIASLKQQGYLKEPTTKEARELCAPTDDRSPTIMFLEFL